jgi:hypothetical protein
MGKIAARVEERDFQQILRRRSQSIMAGLTRRAAVPKTSFLSLILLDNP